MKHDLVIGIDPGVNTGYAVWNCHTQSLVRVTTIKIHEAIFSILSYGKYSDSRRILVRFEDARLRRWFGKNSDNKQQGAGSIKRDCSILQDFLEEYEIDYELVKPSKGMTKWDAETFKKLTGWDGRTSNHARDAALLCYRYNH